MAKIQTIEKLFYYIVTFSYLVFPLFYFFSKDKKGLPLLLCIYGIVVCSYLNIFEYLQDQREYKVMAVLQNLFTFSEYLVFTAIFYMASGKKKRVLFIGLSVGFISTLIFLIVHPIKLKPPIFLDTIPISIETMLIFIYIFFFLYDYSKADSPESIFNNHLFWISVGLLLYLGGSFFFNILANQMSRAEFDNYWHYTYIAEIIKNLLFLVALFKITNVKKKELIPQVRMPYLDIDMN
ncbi:MAG: hypothetical protein DI535_16700 [Citrobacter freundii]|nr:MAG: hypothetical protein DI535_16700 [Citrobacter freundii]